MSSRRIHRLLSAVGAASAAIAMWAVLPSAPASAGFDGDGYNGKCSKVLGDPDCWHYVDKFKTAKACHAKGHQLTAGSEAAAGTPTHYCIAERPSGYQELYVWDSACRANAPYRECPGAR